MFKHRVNGANSDRVNRTSSACVACPDGSPLNFSYLCFAAYCTCNVTCFTCKLRVQPHKEHSGVTYFLAMFLAILINSC